MNSIFQYIQSSKWFHKGPWFSSLSALQKLQDHLHFTCVWTVMSKLSFKPCIKLLLAYFSPPSHFSNKPTKGSWNNTWMWGSRKWAWSKIASSSTWLNLGLFWERKSSPPSRSSELVDSSYIAILCSIYWGSSVLARLARPKYRKTSWPLWDPRI